jgi:undecaprenyl-diphosphatase
VVAGCVSVGDQTAVINHPAHAGEPAGGQVSGTGPRSEAGPLGRVDAATPATPGVVPRPPLGTATTTIVIGFVGLIASLVVLGSVAEGVRTQEVFALDTWATPFLHGIASPGMDALMNTVTEIGSSLVIVPILIVVIAGLLSKRRYGAGLFLGAATGGSLVLQGTMKLFFARPRQQLPWARVLPDYSFPSGHTMNALIFYVAVALILWSVFGRRPGLAALVIAVVIALAVGVSRIYLGYHYLTDVVGGLLAGIAWLLVVGAAFRAEPTWRRWRGDGATSKVRSDGPGGEALG